jgi:iron complex transport system substrate-binding protein
VKRAVVAPALLALAATLFGVAALRGATRGGARAQTSVGVSRIEGRAFPKTVVTEDEHRTIPSPPRRVASLTVTADEILTRLLSPERIAAVTRFADDPTIEAGAGRAPAAAARIRGIDPEGLIALEPDLIFVAHYTLESAVRILGSASIPVVRLRETRSYADLIANVRTTAAAVGEEAKGEAVLHEMQERLDRLTARTAGRARPRVLYYSAVGYTSGSGTLVDDNIRLAGGRNVAAEAGLAGFKNVTLDLLVGLDPEIIVVPRWSADAVGPVRDVMDGAAWRDVSAVRSGRVYALPASGLTAESPDGVAGVEALARLFHPEAFSS